MCAPPPHRHRWKKPDRQRFFRPSKKPRKGAFCLAGFVCAAAQMGLLQTKCPLVQQQAKAETFAKRPFRHSCAGAQPEAQLHRKNQLFDLIGNYFFTEVCGASKALLCTGHPPARVRQISGFIKVSGRLKEKLQTACLSGCTSYARAMTAYCPLCLRLFYAPNSAFDAA